MEAVAAAVFLIDTKVIFLKVIEVDNVFLGVVHLLLHLLIEEDGVQERVVKLDLLEKL